MLKDLTNISSAMNAKSTCNNLEECVKKLSEKYGNVTVHVCTGNSYSIGYEETDYIVTRGWYNGIPKGAVHKYSIIPHEGLQ